MPFELDGTWLAIEARFVREVVGTLPQIVVPNATPQLPALCAWRGRAIPVLDLSQILGIPSEERRSKPRLLVIETGGSVVAIPVSQARAVEVVPKERLRPAHVISNQYCPTEIHQGSFAAGVVDVERIVDDMLDHSETVGENPIAAAQ